jgi:anti-sigma regulatory factor (Ser/Thr protein kinase)
VLWEWKLTEIADDAELVASELLTNAVRASRRPDGPVPAISLRLHTDDTSLLIEVGDHNAEEPALMHSDNDAIGGRGLLLVNALSARWGWQFTGYSHKTVWAVLDSSQKPDQDQ